MLDFIEQTFINFLNMSITGSYIIVAIMLVRLLLKKAPKIYSYCLWAVAGFRLLCKFSFSSVLSIFNLFSVPTDNSSLNGATVNSYVPDDIGTMPVPEISTGIPPADAAINPVLPPASVTESVNPMQIVTAVASVLWIAGMIAMAVYGVVSFIKVHKNIEFATRLDGNVYECESIKSPFVFGVIKPKIYLPGGMDEKQREYVILHEKAHIKRLDHIIKLVAFAVLMLHWYNPLVWLGYSLMIRDMEMSCDERVLKSLNENDKKSYGLTLVSVGANRKFAASAPLSFGENVVEERIVNILKFKKAKVIVAVLCIIACVAVAAVCLTNAKTEKDEYAELEQKIEEYIEKNNLDKVVAAEIVSVSLDNGAYCRINVAYCDFSYSSYLNGKTEKEIEMFRFRVDEALESGYFLTEEGFLSPVTAEVHFDENNEVVHIEGLLNEAPVDMGDEAEYTEILWKKLADNAEDKLENAYGGKYNLKHAELIGSDKLNYLEMYAFEVVDYLGSPVLLVKVKNNLPVVNTVQIPYYRISSDFELRTLDEGSEAEGELLKRKDGKFHENSMYMIEGGSGKEYLCIYELAPYLDSLEKNKNYFVDIDIETPFGEKVDASIKFSVKSDKTYNKKPSLTYESISEGVYAEATEKIVTPISGRISQGYANPITYALSEEDLEEIGKAFNQTTFKEKSAPDQEILYDEVFCVQIQAKDSGTHSIIVVSANTVLSADYSRRLYETNNEILCRTIAEIFYEKQKDAVESSTAAPTLPEGYVPQTKPPKNPDDYTRQPELYTGVKTTQAAVTSEAKPYYAISDIKSYTTGSLSNIKFWGIKYTSAYTGGPYFLMTLINESNNEYYVKNEMRSLVTNGYTLEKLEGNQWKAYNDSSVDLDTDMSKLYTNTLSSVLLPVSELKNGNYRLSLPIYESNEKAGDVTVEFTVTKYMSKEAPAGSKIEKATSFTVTPGYSGVEHVLTNISEEDKKRIVEYYNSFEVIPAEKPSSSLGYEYVQITDSEGNLHAFFVSSTGIITQNGTSFKPQKGELMYKLIQSLYLK
ncbi:MAG: hypothetical protein IJO03_04210 [Clostridia bacterium]|nr:hypothetical protein [Clostridia bacterium]